MKTVLRPETPADHKAVEKITEEAFRTLEISDQTEHLLVQRLRKSEAFIPELSIVTVLEGQIVGHVLVTKLKIKNERETFDSLSLAPVSVKPEFQKKGIGAELVREAHQVARGLGHASIVLVGHPEYYPRFGYELCSKYGIKLPFEAPDEACMVIALVEGGLDGVSGMVEYPKAFFE